ncbi:endo-1,4-beta-xylanase [Paludibacterium purpuratum]|uniref:Glycosyl hydrolase family 10 n=1 Tax=Paludibacterium purpuratum TaxID=1144873 RepID=A0A4R7B4W6_9NEIS|nr:endo-1,4-beta-xylanase [Paludibacterium purpuratum]TDR77815.1 glycosyl hydrolase family 10 [Paludibacterium purpuratum]
MPHVRTCLSLLGAGSLLLAGYADGDPFLGQHLLYLSSYAHIEAKAFDGVRIWGNAGTIWRDIEPVRGQFDFSRMDGLVAAAGARKLDVIHTLGQTPFWASSRPWEIGNMGFGAAAPPKNMNDWSDYVSQVVNRYRDRIGAYEVMNEPRVPEVVRAISPGFYSGSTAQLVEMTLRVQEAVRKNAPAAKVICPAMDGETGPARLQYFLALGGGKYCDVIGFHFYLAHQSVADYRSLLGRVRAAMKQNGIGDKPIWDTETGMMVAQSGYNVRPREPTGPLSVVYGDTEAARHMAKQVLAALQGGVARTYWFAHDSSSMGSTLPDKNTGELNALGVAYRTLRTWLGGTTLGVCTVGDALGDCSLMRGQQRYARIVWGEHDSRTSLMAGKVRRLALLDGSMRNVADLTSDDQPDTLSNHFQDPMLLVY